MILSFKLIYFPADSHRAIDFRGEAAVTKISSLSTSATAELSIRHTRFQLLFWICTDSPLSILKLICHSSVHLFAWGPTDLQPSFISEALVKLAISLTELSASVSCVCFFFQCYCCLSPVCWTNGKHFHFPFSPSWCLDITLLQPFMSQAGADSLVYNMLMRSFIIGIWCLFSCLII